MAVHFDSSSFGQVVIDGRPYGDILVIGKQIEERDDSRLDQELGTDHLIGNWEVEELLSNNPEVVIIGAGTAGLLEVRPEIKEKFRKAKVELVVLNTPAAIQKYNQLALQNKRVNILTHTTC